MTSLKLQLQALKGASTSPQTDFSSFLFSSKDASRIDQQALHSLACNGFLELRKMDERFGSFEKNLFDSSSVSLNRQTKSLEENKKLDQLLSSFLILLSPYFLLKPAHKVLEFLIRRFRIHQYDTSAIVEAILPYHATRLFSRMIRILKLSKTPWSVFSNVKSFRDGVPRSFIVQECIRDPPLLITICNTAKKFVERDLAPKQWLSFYSVLLMEVIRDQNVIHNGFLQPLLPFLISGIEAKSNPFYQISSYMTISQLSTRTSLSSGVTQSFLKLIAKHVNKNNEEALTNALLTILLLTQTQKIEHFSPQLLKFITSIPDVVTILSRLEENYQIDSLVSLIIQAVLDVDAVKDKSKGVLLINRLLTELGKLSESAVRAIACKSLQLFFSSSLKMVKEEKEEEEEEEEEEEKKKKKKKMRDEEEENDENHGKKDSDGGKYAKKLKSRLMKLLRLLELKHQGVFDSELEASLSRISDPKLKGQALDLIADVFGQVSRFQPIPETGLTLFLSLNHPDRKIRLAAINVVGKVAEKLSLEAEGHEKNTSSSSSSSSSSNDDDDDDEKEKDEEKEQKGRLFYKDSLLSRLLNDDDTELISTIVGIPNLLLFFYSDKDMQELFDALVSILEKNPILPSSTADSIFGLIGKSGQRCASLQSRVVGVLANHFVPSSHSVTLCNASRCASQYLNISLFNDVHNLLIEQVASPESINSSNTMLVKLLSDNLAKHPEALDSVVELISSPICQRRTRRLFLLCLDVYLASAPFSDQSCQIIVLLLNFLQAEKKLFFSEEASKKETQVQSALSSLSSMLDTYQTYATVAFSKHILRTIINHLPKLRSQLPASALTIFQRAILSSCKEGDDDLFSFSVVCSVFKFLLNQVSLGEIDSAIIQTIFQRFFENRTLSVEFLVAVFCSPRSEPLVRLRCVNLIKLFLSTPHAEEEQSPRLLVFLVLALFDPIKHVRLAALSCLSLIASFNLEKFCLSTVKYESLFHSIWNPKKTSAKSDQVRLEPAELSLFSTIALENANEIQLDRNHISRIMKLDTLPTLRNLVLSCFMALPHLSAQTRVVSMFTELQDVRKFYFFNRPLNELLRKNPALISVDEVQFLREILSQYNHNIDLQDEGHASFSNILAMLKLFSAAVLGDRTRVKPISTSMADSPMMTLLSNVPVLFSKMNQIQTNSFTTALIDLLHLLPDSMEKVRIFDILKTLNLSTEHLVSLLVASYSPKVIEQQTSVQTPNRKKQRRLDNDDVSINRHRTMALLELLQAKELIETPQHLIEPLFKTLKAVNEKTGSFQDENVNLNYLVSLILGALHNISQLLIVQEPEYLQQAEGGRGLSLAKRSNVGVAKLKASLKESAKEIEAAFKVDLIVSTIKSSENVQIHNKALTLLSAVSDLFPRCVLNHVMPIFTFMGASSLNQDDSYTFKVIQQTIQSIVPSVITQGDQRDCWQVASIFVNALENVPSHRRELLFLMFVRSLTFHYYHLVLLLLLAKDLKLKEDQLDNVDDDDEDDDEEEDDDDDDDDDDDQDDEDEDDNNEEEEEDNNEEEEDESDENERESMKQRERRGTILSRKKERLVKMMMGKSMGDSVFTTTSKINYREFGRGLSCQFPPAPIIVSFTKLVSAVVQLLSSTDSQTRGEHQRPALKLTEVLPPSLKEDFFLFNGVKDSLQNLLFICHSALSIVSQCLSEESFLKKIVELNEKEKKTLQRFLMSLFRNTLVLCRKIGLVKHESERHQVSKSVQLLFEKSIGVSYEVIEKTNELMSLHSFITAIDMLLDHGDAQIRRRSLIILNEKLSELPEKVEENQLAIFLGLVEKLSSTIRGRAEGEEPIANKQTALFSMEILARNFIQQMPQVFKDTLINAVLPSLDSELPQVVSSALICTATHCAYLKSNCIELLPRILPKLLDILSKCLNNFVLPSKSTAGVGVTATAALSGEEQTQVLMQVSALSSLEVLIESLHDFVSPYLQRLLVTLSHPTLLNSRHPAWSQLKGKNHAILDTLARRLELRLLLPSVFESFRELERSSSSNRAPASALSFSHMLKFLRHVFKLGKRDAVIDQYTASFKFFLFVFDYRHRRVAMVGLDNKATMSLENDIQQVEMTAIRAFKEFVVKLSEQLFRPVFHKLLDWVQVSPIDQKISRNVLFTKLIDSLAGKLQSLFVPYFAYLLDYFASIFKDPLQLLTKDKQQDNDAICQADYVICYCISALHKCFMYHRKDIESGFEEKFFSRERYDLIMPSLVDLLEIRANSSIYDTITSCLVLCLGQFAVALANEKLWQPLNYRVMLKTRNPSARIRKASLQVVQEFYTRLGEEFLPLVTESIPFFSELMEDSDVEVEKLCQEVMALINRHMGEDKIENYL